MKFDTPPAAIEELNEEYSRDVDIIKRNIFKSTLPPEFTCTLAEELLPPAYR